MQTLTLSNGFDDYKNKFVIEVNSLGNIIERTVSLMQDYKTRGDGIYWASCDAVCIQHGYTAEECESIDRLNAMTPIRKNDIVLIDGIKYKANVLGNYSNCAIFEKI